MDLHGIGFSNIRMATASNDYTYIYDTRINIFPEEVYIHEFLHTLEKTLVDYKYDIPALHDYNNYGYEEQKLIGLRDWYEDYMNSNILDKKTNEKVGLNEDVYSLKPAQKSNFNYSVKMNFINEPQNLFEEIKSLVNVVANAI